MLKYIQNINFFIEKEGKKIIENNNVNELLNYLKRNIDNNIKDNLIKLCKKTNKQLLIYLLLLSKYFNFNNYIIFYEELISINEYIFIFLDENEKNCITFTLQPNNNNININSLDKCSVDSGNKLLEKLEFFANDITTKFKTISLDDGSNIIFCNEIYSISLTFLDILSSGNSWYNKQGYISNNYNKEQVNNNKFINQKIINFIDYNKFSNTIKDTILFIIDNIANIDNITIKELFILIKKYLKSITNFCNNIEKKHINNIINLINLFKPYIIYDYKLIKQLNNNINIGGNKKNKTKKNKTKKQNRK